MRNISKKTAIVWTNTENRDGIKAAALLRRTGVKVEVRDIDSSKWKKSDVEASVPGYTTLPQIVFDGAVVGDLAAVKSHPKLGAKLKKTKLDHAARIAKAAENKTTWMNNKKAAAAERALAAKSVVKGRLNHPTEEQKAAALARAVAAKSARADHAAARVAAIKAARV
jgi:glutaredoxin